MSVIDQAVLELKLANFQDNEIEVLRKILALFFETWDSGGAVWVMAPILQRCIAGKCLTPLTGADSEWMDVSEGFGGKGPVKQNIRCSTVFTDEDGRSYDIDTPGRPTITFPYWPDNADDTTTRRERIQREINGAPIDFGGDGGPREIATGHNTVRVGDRFRFSMDAAKFILNEPHQSTVVVVLSEITVEPDGCKRLIVVPE